MSAKFLSREQESEFLWETVFDSISRIVDLELRVSKDFGESEDFVLSQISRLKKHAEICLEQALEQ